MCRFRRICFTIVSFASVLFFGGRISAQTLVSLTVSPGTPSVAAGVTQPFDAVGTYDDNSTQDLTTVVTWTSSDPTIADIDITGNATAVDNGQATIQAIFGGVSGSATLTVTPGQLDAVVTAAYQPSNGSSAWPSQKAIGVGSDGFSRFVVGDSSGAAPDDEVVYVRCLDEDCTTSNTATFQTGAWTFDYSMALGPDGLARIAYTTFDSSLVPDGHSSLLVLIQCSDDDCVNFTTTTVDGASDNGVDSVTVASDGTAYLAYDFGGDNWDSEQGIGLATCGVGGCSTTQVAQISVNDCIGGAITMGQDGNPVMVYEDSGDGWSTLDSVHFYASGTDTVISSNGWGGTQTQDVALGPDGFARVTYMNTENGADFIPCTNSTCAGSGITSIPFSQPYGEAVSVEVGSDGNALMQTLSVGNGNWAIDYIQCAQADCSKSSDELVAGSWQFDHLASLSLDPSGFGRMIAQTSSGQVAHIRANDECPTSVTLSSAISIPLENEFPLLSSGIGILAGMQVTPPTNPSSGNNWNGTVISEDVHLNNINSCPSSVPIGHGSDIFLVGCIFNSGEGWLCAPGSTRTRHGIQWSATDNIFWDWHIRGSSSSYLNAPGVTQSQCTQTYSQSYYCKKKVIGRFGITYNFSLDTIQGTSVTRVQVVDQ